VGAGAGVGADAGAGADGAGAGADGAGVEDAAALGSNDPDDPPRQPAAASRAVAKRTDRMSRPPLQARVKPRR